MVSHVKYGGRLHTSCIILQACSGRDEKRRFIAAYRRNKYESVYMAFQRLWHKCTSTQSQCSWQPSYIEYLSEHHRKLSHCYEDSESSSCHQNLFWAFIVASRDWTPTASLNTNRFLSNPPKQDQLAGRVADTISLLDATSGVPIRSVQRMSSFCLSSKKLI